MNVIRVRQGRDIKLKGAATKDIVDANLPSQAAIQPPDFRGLRARLLVKEGDTVQVGTPLLEDKNNQQIRVVSPGSGQVAAINRGEKRALLEVVISLDGKQETVGHRQYTVEEIKGLSRQDTITHLLTTGVWPCLRQRPFSHIVNPEHTPKSIFVHAMNTEPLALDVDAVLKGEEPLFETGLEILTKLTEGQVHVCCDEQAQSPALTDIPGKVERSQAHRFSGPHPTGNVSTHIHYIDPIQKGDLVWYIRAEDVLRVAVAFLNGVFSPQRYVAVTGEGAKKRNYRKTIVGAPLAHLVEGDPAPGMRFVSGSVLVGRNVGPKGFLCFYDSQITILPEGGKRELLGWLVPGFQRYSFSKTFASSFKREEEASLDTDKNGSDRAIVLNHIYDSYVPLDILTFFLLKAILAGDIEEAERLGILECDEEDFALASFACPSKTDVGGIIRDGLEIIEKEG